MSENRDIHTAGKNFTLQPAVTAVTNLTSDHTLVCKELLKELLKMLIYLNNSPLTSFSPDG